MDFIEMGTCCGWGNIQMDMETQGERVDYLIVPLIMDADVLYQSAVRV